MNRDSTPHSNTPGQNPAPPDAATDPREAALEDVRQRVEAGRRKRLEAARLESEQLGRRRAPTIFASGSTSGLLAGIFGDRMILMLAVSALFLVIPALFWLAEALRWPFYYAIRSLDVATGARALRWAPFLMWTVWGGVFGGCLGYWLVAPIYGDRENRSFWLLLPSLAMVIIGALLWAFVR